MGVCEMGKTLNGEVSAETGRVYCEPCGVWIRPGVYWTRHISQFHTPSYEDVKADDQLNGLVPTHSDTSKDSSNKPSLPLRSRRMPSMADLSKHSGGVEPEVTKPITIVETFRLRLTTNKYYLLCDTYRQSDKDDLKPIARAFAKAFGISSDTVKYKKHAVLWQTDDSDYYGNGTLTTRVELWLLLKWAQNYHTIEYYPSPHVDDTEGSDLPIRKGDDDKE